MPSNYLPSLTARPVQSKKVLDTHEVFWGESTTDQRVHNSLEKQYLELLGNYQTGNYTPGEYKKILENVKPRTPTYTTKTKSPSPKKERTPHPIRKPFDDIDINYSSIQSKRAPNTIHQFVKTFTDTNTGQQIKKKFKIIEVEGVEECIEYSEEEYQDVSYGKIKKRWCRSRRNDFQEEFVFDSKGKRKTIRKKIRSDQYGHDVEVEYSEDSFDDPITGKHRRVWKRREKAPATYIEKDGVIKKRRIFFNPKLKLNEVIEYSDDEGVWRRKEKRTVVEDYIMDQNGKPKRIRRKIDPHNLKDAIEYSEDEDGNWHRRAIVKQIFDPVTKKKILRKFINDGNNEYIDYSEYEFEDEDTGQIIKTWHKKPPPPPPLQTKPIGPSTKSQSEDEDEKPLRVLKSKQSARPNKNDDQASTEEEIFDSTSDTLVPSSSSALSESIEETQKTEPNIQRKLDHLLLLTPKPKTEHGLGFYSDSLSSNTDKEPDTKLLNLLQVQPIPSDSKEKDSQGSENYSETQSSSEESPKTKSEDMSSHSTPQSQTLAHHHSKVQQQSKIKGDDGSSTSSTSSFSSSYEDKQTESANLVTSGSNEPEFLPITIISPIEIIEAEEIEEEEYEEEVLENSEIFVDGTPMVVYASDDEVFDDDTIVILVSQGNEGSPAVPYAKRLHKAPKKYRSVATQATPKMDHFSPNSTVDVLPYGSPKTADKLSKSMKLTPQQLRQQFLLSSPTKGNDYLGPSVSKKQRAITKEEFEEMTYELLENPNPGLAFSAMVPLTRMNKIIRQSSPQRKTQK